MPAIAAPAPTAQICPESLSTVKPSRCLDKDPEATDRQRTSRGTGYGINATPCDLAFTHKLLEELEPKHALHRRSERKRIPCHDHASPAVDQACGLGLGLNVEKPIAADSRVSLLHSSSTCTQ